MIVLTAAAAVITACGFVREEPREDVAGVDVWRGDVAWIEVEFSLVETEGTFSGEGLITKSPVDGRWESNDVTVNVSLDDLAIMTGTWTAEWGSGHMRGEMDHPTVNLSLFRTGETEAAARLRGLVQENYVTWIGTMQRDDRTTFLRLDYQGKLPLIEIDVTGTRTDDRIILQFGPYFEFGGGMSDRTMSGVIVASAVGHYPLTLRKGGIGARSVAWP